MASRTSTPRSRSRSRSSTSSASSDTTMLDAPPLAPTQPRPASHNNPPSSTTSSSSSSSSAAAAAQANAKDPSFSLLLSLPRELRDRIYIYALTSQYPFWYPAQAPVTHNIALGLLTACRQIYEESAPILYSANKFLFTHPSDCNIFRVVASPTHSSRIQAVYFRVRDKDLRLWTSYMGSKNPDRSMRHDLPKLKVLWVFLRCGNVGVAGLLGGLPPGMIAHLHAQQHAAQQIQQQFQAFAHALGAAGQAGNGNGGGNNHAHAPAAVPFNVFANGGNLGGHHGHGHHAHHHHHHHPHPPPPQPHAHGTHNNPPNPSPLAQMATHPHLPHQTTYSATHPPFYSSFLRWERELGLENLCLSMQETRPVDCEVKVVCIMRLPKPEVVRLCRIYPDELSVDRNGDARTRFRKVHDVEVSLEITGFDVTM